MKKCVFTCITGLYDKLSDIRREPGFDYICFTNNPLLKSATWSVIHIDDILSDLVLARKVKLLAHQYLPDYDLTIWMDAPIIVKESITSFLENECELDRYDMVCFKHSRRDCIYDEIEACVNLGKETPKRAGRIRSFLEEQQYPAHNGLIESTVMVRKNKREINQLMEDWYSILIRYSRRDQLSFNYCLWKRPVSIKFLDMHVYHCKYFDHAGHKRSSIFRYRLIFDIEGASYKAVRDGRVLIDRTDITIREICPMDTNTIVLFNHNLEGYGATSVILNNSSRPSEYRGFLQFNNNEYFHFGSSIVFHGDFHKDELIELRKR